MDKAPLKIRDGRTVDAMTPVILSASRSTDIPAYYAKWFIERIKEGYAVWINPFNQKPSYVSFEKTRVIVFWTKNPEPLLPYLSILDDMGLNYYFQFTLNDYGQNIEGVPTIRKRLDTFARLYEHVGSKRIIWRYDPIMLNDTDLRVENHLEKINNLGKQLKGMTDKLVFSYVDINYPKVKNNLLRLNLYTQGNISKAEPDDNQKKAIAKGISDLRTAWKKDLNWDVALATCAEDIDLKSFGIERNKCIDPELIDELFSHKDPALRDSLENFRNKAYTVKQKKEVKEQNELFPLNTEDQDETEDENNELFPQGNSETPKKQDKVEDGPFLKKFKDKGQRTACGCVISKDIGMYNTCLHQCAYCYANTSNEAAMNNHKNHRIEDESIIPFKRTVE